MQETIKFLYKIDLTLSCEVGQVNSPVYTRSLKLGLSWAVFCKLTFAWRFCLFCMEILTYDRRSSPGNVERTIKLSVKVTLELRLNYTSNVIVGAFFLSQCQVKYLEIKL